MLVVGGIYLCWLGYQMLRSALSKKETVSQHHFELPQSNLRFFLKGFLTNLSNPKAVIYFGSCIFSVFSQSTFRWGAFIIIYNCFRRNADLV